MGGAEGLRGAHAYQLFDGYCQRLVIDGTQLWRAHLAMETLHPQWNGYGYVWRRDLNAIEPEQYAHGSLEEDDWLKSAQPTHREGPRRRGKPDDAPAPGAVPDQRDFPVLVNFSPPATNYLAYIFAFGKDGDRSQGTGIVYSFATDRRGGFSDDDTEVLQATLPALSLAMKSHASFVIASGMLGTYLGEDADDGFTPARSCAVRSTPSRRDLVRRHPRLHADQRFRARPRHCRIAQ